MILGPDPGRGSSYWQEDHGDYYSQPAAHNTVIVNGRATYRAQGPGHIPMKVELVEPAFGTSGVSPNISFAQGSFAYPLPAAKQRRTLVLIRTGPRSGFYVDVFRSKVEESSEGYHDYLYHNIGQSLARSDATGAPLSLSPSARLGSKHGDMKGYDYFKNEKQPITRATSTASSPSPCAAERNVR